MKKIITLCMLMILGFSGLKSYSQNCDLIGSNLSTNFGLWQLTFQGIPIYAPNSENIVLRLAPNPNGILTGDLMLIQVRCGVTYVFQTCGQVAFDSYIRIFSANIPGNPLIAENDDFCGLQSSLGWTATFTGSIWVSVNEFPCGNGGQPVGMLTVAITPPVPAVCPANDACNNATPIACGQSIAGTTLGGTVDNVSPCGSSPFEPNGIAATAPGVWYSITGNGQAFLASVCGAAQHDSKISVYSGSCNNLACVTANDDADGCGLTSEVSFCSEQGVNYFILVHGFSTARGQFVLSVECAQPPTVAIVDPTSCPTHYFGWSGSECATLRAAGSGGVRPYTYSWAPANEITSGAGSASACVAPTTPTTYTVTITDALGCSAEATLFVDAIDISCGSPNSDKVIMCHKADQPSAHTHCVKSSEIAKNLASDKSAWALGPCNPTCNAATTANDPCEPLVVNVLTDDFGGEVSWTLIDNNTGELIGSASAFTLNDNTQFSDTFCVDPNHCYDFQISDEFGDGICCLSGQGTWSIELQGNVTNSPTGGNYGSGESIQVCGSGPSYVDPCPAGQVTMCHKPNRPSAHTHCVDQAKVASKLAKTDWALGPCPGMKATSAAAEDILFEAFPNPFSNATTLRFRMDHDAHVVLKVYSITGTEIATLYEGMAVEGEMNQVEFEASKLSAGVYFSKLTADSGEILIQKLIVE